jgi:hypothetical protein
VAGKSATDAGIADKDSREFLMSSLSPEGWDKSMGNEHAETHIALTRSSEKLFIALETEKKN